MLRIELEVKQKPYEEAEACGRFSCKPPVTRDEYMRFCDELNKAKDMAAQAYEIHSQIGNTPWPWPIEDEEEA